MPMSAPWPPLGVYGHDYALAPEPLGRLPDEPRVFFGARVYGYLVGARPQELPYVLEGRCPSPHGKGHEDLGGRLLHHVDYGLPLLVGGRYVEEDELVGALLLIGLGALHRVPGVS